jgi:SAM-dependent methyltransferase
MALETDHLDLKTIADFGEQWAHYRNNDGYYGSQALFKDILGPLIAAEDLRGKVVADIGSGTGRIVAMLLDAGAAHVTAVEPSEAIKVLLQNLQCYASRVTAIQATGDCLPPTGFLDFVFSIGVLHHVRDPAPIVRAAWRALKPGGQMVVWLYGRENNEAYLRLLGILRAISTSLPHHALVLLTWALFIPLRLYIRLCKSLRLPMADYMVHVLGKMSPDKQRLVIYDQLNPEYAKYYTRDEAISLLHANGFVNVRVHHRNGYSWTVVGVKEV